MLEKILAKTGFDSFLESHPQVTYLKKLAKKLHKKNKISGLKHEIAQLR